MNRSTLRKGMLHHFVELFRVRAALLLFVFHARTFQVSSMYYDGAYRTLSIMVNARFTPFAANMAAKKKNK